LIRQKLDDIAFQSYPKELMEIFIVDSASTDGTVEVVKEWIADHRDVRAKLIEENVRRGKAYALDRALENERKNLLLKLNYYRSELDKLLASPLIEAVSRISPG
jgi:Glycosyltransferases, probably involved in cell wall biogenesis